MKKPKKAIVLLLAILLTASLCTACSEKGINSYKWQDGVIVIDGVLYHSYYDPYSKLPENGWDFEFSSDGIKSTDKLPANSHPWITIGKLMLLNDKYTNSVDNSLRPYISVSFINKTDTALPYKECTIRNIEVNGAIGFKPYEESNYAPCPCYDFELPSGVRRGSSKEEIIAAYGEPTRISKVLEDYETLTYETSTMELELKVFKKYGLQGVWIKDYRYREN